MVCHSGRYYLCEVGRVFFNPLLNSSKFKGGNWFIPILINELVADPTAAHVGRNEDSVGQDRILGDTCLIIRKRNGNLDRICRTRGRY